MAGAILELKEHVEKVNDAFLMRVEWERSSLGLPRDEIASTFGPIGERFSMNWSLHFSDYTPKMAVFATKQ